MAKAVYTKTLIGRNWNNSSNAGSFFLNVNNAPSNRNRNIGTHSLYAQVKKIMWINPCLGSCRNIIINQLGCVGRFSNRRLGPVVHTTKRKGDYMIRHKHPIGDKSKTLWEAICSMENLELAHKNAKKGKGWYKEVKQVDANPELYLSNLQKMLLEKTYKTSEYKIFTKQDKGKKRNIYKLPYYPDRICQWALLQIIEPILIRKLTADTYSAIPGRGIHQALNRLKKVVRKDKIGTKYCLKLDIKKYYPSINHNILKQKYKNTFKDKNVIWLLEEIIDSTPGDVGIPIGNYLSQYSGNFYLSDFDHWIKEVKMVKYYYRYMDDIVILGESKKQLHKMRINIHNYFNNNLKLEIKNNWQVFPIADRGIDFLGYRVFPKYTLLRKRICVQMKQKMRMILNNCKKGNEMTHSEWCSIFSYWGWLIHGDCFMLIKKYIKTLQIYANLYYNKYIKGKEVVA